MLLDFTLKNFKSFIDESKFSMIPAPKLKGLDYSVLNDFNSEQKVKALCSSVIYGPNASGKTNLLSAMKLLNYIVASGTILPSDALDNREMRWLISLAAPTITEDMDAVELGVRVFYKDIFFQYSIKFVVEGIQNTQRDRKIVSEKLQINGEDIFTRTNNILVIGKNVYKIVRKNGEHIDINGMKLLDESLRDTDVFLTKGFNILSNNGCYEKIMDWFRKGCVIDSKFTYNSTTITRPIFADNEKVKHVGYLTEVAQEFGSSNNQIIYRRTEGNDDPAISDELKGVQVFTRIKDSKGNFYMIPSRLFESLGTQTMINLFPLVITALVEGNTLVLDEMDTSIHPMAIMSLVNAFHNDEINKNGAQLIFTTHNPVFLNKNLFRRDEIKFIDKDENGRSEIYALSDFGTAGTIARNTSDYMKNYFVDKYGAIKHVDFTDIFKKILGKEEVLRVAEE